MIRQIEMRGDDGNLLGTVSLLRNPHPGELPPTVTGKDACRKLLNALRDLPLDAVIVTINYPLLDRCVIFNDLNQESGVIMDLSHLYAAREQAKSGALPARMVAPLPNVVPEDSIVQFVTVETLKDVMDAPQQAVLLFPEDAMELLGMIVEHPTIIGFAPFVLSGLPSADYHAQFESKTYALERVAYPSLINDLIERKRVADALADQNATPYEDERRQFTRKGGGVKELKGIKIAGRPDPSEPADADGE